jgi:hypothetical protein
MSRSGYVDDDDDYINLYRGSVNRAIRGKRGQTLLLELRDAMDAMPVKELIAHELIAEGNFCALGVVGQARNLPLADMDPEDIETVARMFNIADCMAREIVYLNDEAYWKHETPAQRWYRMRAWVESNILKGGAV